MQVATITTTFTAEEEAEVKEVDVATCELKSRHHDQQLKSAACLGGCRDKRSEVATSGAIN